MRRKRRDQVYQRADHSNHEIVREWAEKWRSLRCWGKPLTCGLRILGKHEDGRMGDCTFSGDLVRIFDSGVVTDDLSTVLHEYAHVVTSTVPEGPEGHGKEWRDAFGMALVEVTGEPLPDRWRTRSQMDWDWLDAQADDMILRWWRKMGYDLAEKLGSGSIHADRQYRKTWARTWRGWRSASLPPGYRQVVADRTHLADWTGFQVDSILIDDYVVQDD